MSLDESAPVLLAGPADYFAADDLERFTICNGCGSAAAKFDFVPDTIYGVSVLPACYIHDWRYYFGQTEQDRLVADREFLDNMLTLIEEAARLELMESQGWIYGPKRAVIYTLRVTRRWRATTYYSAVRDKGGNAFWAGKTRVRS